MVSSMMVVPVACAMQLGKNFKQTVWYAVGLKSCCLMIIGLLGGLIWAKPGGTIFGGVAALLIIFIGKRIVFGKQE